MITLVAYNYNIISTLGHRACGRKHHSRQEEGHSAAREGSATVGEGQCLLEYTYMYMYMYIHHVHVQCRYMYVLVSVMCTVNVPDCVYCCVQ